MQKHFETKSKLFLYTFAVTAVFYILAGGYRFFNTMYSGDSLLMIYQNDAAWQIAIGRFLQPFIVMFRGGMVSPFLISVLAMIWTGLSAFFLVDYLRIRHPFYIALTGAVMVCNITVVAGNATFLPTVDCFAMALFFAVLSVWLMEKKRISYRITLDSQEDIQSLFSMTPYYYRTAASQKERLSALDKLETTVDFELLAYRIDRK